MHPLGHYSDPEFWQKVVGLGQMKVPTYGEGGVIVWPVVVQVKFIPAIVTTRVQEVPEIVQYF
jgi:hypothetical protein